MEPDGRLVGPVIGIVLVGGAAARLGGIDKSRLDIGGRTILDRILARLDVQCARVILSVHDDPAPFAALGRPIVRDRAGDREGPLAGIVAGLAAAAEAAPTAHTAVTVPGDTPFLPDDLVPRLEAARAAGGAPLACARSGGRRHPVVALWPLALQAALRADLAAGERRLGVVLARHGAAEAEWPIDPYDPFCNVNTPDDLAAARALAATHGL